MRHGAVQDPRAMSHWQHDKQKRTSEGRGGARGDGCKDKSLSESSAETSFAMTMRRAQQATTLTGDHMRADAQNNDNAQRTTMQNGARTRATLHVTRHAAE
eukprot:130773-Pyramimonas_sp.AAC.1